MKKIIIVFISFIIFVSMMLTSCELFLSEPKGRIIVIGTGMEYTDVSTLSTLSGTVNDIKMLPAALNELSEKEGKKLYFIPLTDEAPVNSFNYATKEQIKNSIDYLIDNSQAHKPLIIDEFNTYDLTRDSDNSTIEYYDGNIILNPNDILIFHYSGHGSNTGSLVLRKKNNQELVEELELKTFYDYFDDVPCKTLLLIDSCYSGAVIPESSTTISTNDPRINATWFSDYFSFLFDENSDHDSLIEENSNIYIISATTSEKKSTENANTEKRNGSFTFAVLESLGWGIEKDVPSSLGKFSGDVPSLINGSVTIDGIYEYISGIEHSTDDYDARIVGGRYDLVLFDL